MDGDGWCGDLRVDHPVFTLDRRMLVPAGTLLTWEGMNDLARSGEPWPGESLPLFHYESVRRDIVQFMGHDPYRTIFEAPSRTDSILSLVERVRLPLPVLESLSYFKLQDGYTYRHILMVFALSALLARDLLESDLDRMQEALAGPVHDFGKICVPMEILKKTSPLTRTERGILEHHTVAGYILLSFYTGDCRSFGATVARDHHERGDGSGYPRGFLLRDRMVEIIAACDVYDALISPRPYRPTSYENRTALEEITEMGLNGKLSWEVVQTLVAYNRKEKPHYRECTVSVEKRGTPPADNLYGILADEESGFHREDDPPK